MSMKSEIFVKSVKKCLVVEVNMITDEGADIWHFDFPKSFPMTEWKSLLEKMENSESEAEFYVGNNGKYGESNWEIYLQDKDLLLRHRIRGLSVDFKSTRSRKIDVMIPIIKEIITLCENLKV